jgi:protease stability complex PrcB-like protein
VARRLLLIGLTTVLVLAAVAAAVAAQRVGFRTVAKGNGASSALTRPAGLVVKGTRRWRSVWESLNSGVQPTPALPKVDFARRMLLVAIQGRKSSGGYSIVVTSVMDEGRRWRVNVEERSPGPTCIVPSVLTSPYHVVRVRRTHDTVKFIRHRRTVSCAKR